MTRVKYTKEDCARIIYRALAEEILSDSKMSRIAFEMLNRFGGEKNEIQNKRSKLS